MINSPVQTSEIRLGDITIKIGSGATPRGGKESYKSHGISLIRSMNVYDLAFDYSNLAFIDQAQARQLDNVTVKEYDILLNITGASVARCCMVPKRILPARVNQHVAIIRCEKTEANPMYIQYCLVSPKYKESLLTIAQGGATREALTKEKIEDFKVPYHNLPTQHKIPAIPSAYDDLIENNTRRITILKEMAQRLYREWFVHFRYPGHEKNNLVESELGLIPEGWEVVSTVDLADILGGGTPSTKVPEYWSNGTVNWFAPREFTKANSMFMLQSEIKISELGLKKSSAKLFPPYSIMLTSRATIGKVGINTTEACTNQGFITCIPQEVNFLFYFYFWLLNNVDLFHTLASGATFKELSKSTFREINLLKPSFDSLEKFDKIARPIGDKILNLQKKQIILKQTRDLLLPKLISGKIDVSQLDIDTGE